MIPSTGTKKDYREPSLSAGSLPCCFPVDLEALGLPCGQEHGGFVCFHIFVLPDRRKEKSQWAQRPGEPEYVQEKQTSLPLGTQTTSSPSSHPAAPGGDLRQPLSVVTSSKLLASPYPQFQRQVHSSVRPLWHELWKSNEMLCKLHTFSLLLFS